LFSDSSRNFPEKKEKKEKEKKKEKKKEFFFLSGFVPIQ